MAEQELRVSVTSEISVTAISTPPRAASRGWLFAYAPGAGSNVHDSFGRYACTRLADRGIGSVRFQFPYTEARRRRPDRNDVLEDTWRAAIEAVRTKGARLVVGGRSMGGRIASQVVAQGGAVDALALFAYPLHPPGDLSRRRDGHLPEIAVPTLFCSGTRDTFAGPDELHAAAAKVRHAHVHLIDGADHGFGVLKSGGRTREDVYEEATSALVDWLRRL